MNWDVVLRLQVNEASLTKIFVKKTEGKLLETTIVWWKAKTGYVHVSPDRNELIAAGCISPDMIGGAEAYLYSGFLIKREIKRMDLDNRSEGGT